MFEIKSVSKTFNSGTPEELRALNNVSLSVGEGSFTVILGGNGSGKSTLLNMVAGAFFTDAGKISMDGKDITRWPEYKRASFMGRVFQNPFTGTAPDMTIAENFALAARRGQNRGLGWALSRSVREDIRARVVELGLGLEDRLDAQVGMLSGGQRQALTLLMATWQKPRLLLLDEHTAALDPKSSDRLILLTRNIIEREKLTVLMVTHSMQQAIRLGNRLIMLHHGEIVSDFSGAEKRRLQADELLNLFDELRKSDQLDASAAEMIQALYV